MIEFTLNGELKKLDIAVSTPLLWVLRDEFRLTGTKIGCGIGQCGACTVHLDGRAVRACIVLLGALGGGNITTIEGSPDSGLILGLT